MIRKYAFKVKVETNHGNSFLRIKPNIGTNGWRIKKMDPIYFSELNVPIVVNSPGYYAEIGWDCDYFLDFENGFDGNGGAYNCFKRDKQMKILSILEGQVEQDIIDFLNGGGVQIVKGKTIKFEADDGLSFCSSSSKRKFGSPRKAPRQGVARTKKLSS